MKDGFYGEDGTRRSQSFLIRRVLASLARDIEAFIK
jgi:hypothetical protein